MVFVTYIDFVMAILSTVVLLFFCDVTFIGVNKYYVKILCKLYVVVTSVWGPRFWRYAWVHSHGGFVRISVAKLRSVYRAGGLEGSGDWILDSITQVLFDFRIFFTSSLPTKAISPPKTTSLEKTLTACMLFIITKGGMSTLRNVYKQGHFVMQTKHLLL